MNDRQDEVTQDALEAVESSEAEVLESSDETSVADDTLDAPLITTEMWIAANGERKYSRSERLLRDLNQAIVDHPESPTNYVLRGELALGTRDYEQAAADFEKALELASAQVETNDWGIIAQTMQDRAYRGLTEAKRRLKR